MPSFSSSSFCYLVGMVRGIVQSAVFMLVLTRGVFERPFIQFEVRTAGLLKKKIIMVRALA